MNRLWVRLQHMGGNKGRKRRERERLELRLLVGGQLSRLSMLSGLDAATYSSSVLPRLLEEVRACRDRIAQPYLFECILQAFPIDFTHATLQQLLEALPRLVPDPAVAKACVASLLTRLREEAVAATAALHEAAGNGDAAAKALLAGRAEDGRLAGLQATPTSLAAAAAGGAATPAPLAGLDVFGMLLAAVDTLARDPAGPFRAPRGGDREGSGGGDAGTGEGFPGGSAASVITLFIVGAARAAPQPTPPECVAALLEVYAALAAFALACYPGHLPHVDAVLGSTAGSLREALAAGSAEAAAEGAGRGATGNEASTAAANSKGGSAAGRSALNRLTGGGAAAAAAPADAEEGAEGKEGGARARGFGNGAAGLSSLALDDDCSKLVVSLLGQVQGALGLAVLSLEHYAGLMAPLRFVYRRSIAGKLLDAVLAAGQRVAAPDTARRLCATLSPLLRDEEGSGGEGDEASEQFAGEQARVAKLVLLFGATSDRGFNAAVAQAAAPPAAPPAESAAGDKAAAEEAEAEKALPEASAAGPLSLPVTPETDTDAHFSVLVVAQEALSHGGSRRIGATLPPLVFSTLQLLRRVAVRERIAAANPSAAPLRFGYRRIFEFLLELVRGLASSHTELALRLTLQCALAAEAGDIAEEFTSTGACRRRP